MHDITLYSIQVRKSITYTHLIPHRRTRQYLMDAYHLSAFLLMYTRFVLGLPGKVACTHYTLNTAIHVYLCSGGICCYYFGKVHQFPQHIILCGKSVRGVYRRYITII